MLKRILFVLLCALVLLPMRAADYFITPTGVGSGLSWTDAASLSQALEFATLVDGDVLHLAAGTYVPSTIITGGVAADLKDRTFEISKNITLIGGYPAMPIQGDTPNAEQDVTILSADAPEGQLYHVAVLNAPKTNNAAIRLQGLTFTGGVATGVGYIKINDANYYRTCGGALSVGANVEITNCILHNNRGSATGGGAIYAFNGANIKLTNTTLRQNSAGANGGALYAFTGTTLSIDYCQFIENQTTSGNIGALYINGCKDAIITNTLFKKNASGQPSAVAGAVQVFGKVKNVLIANCLFDGNTSPGNGSAIYFRDGSNCKLINTTFINNAVTGGGRGTVSTHANVTLNVANCTFVNNTIASANTADYVGFHPFDTTCSSAFYNTLFHNNKRANGTLADLDPTKSTLIHSIAESMFYASNGVVTGQAFDNSQVGQLTDNGGFTHTVALSGPLPSISLGQLLSHTFATGLPVDYLCRDQRGFMRDATALSLGAYDVGKTLDISSGIHHFLIYGQSLATGYQSYPALTTTPVEGNYMIGNQPWVHLNNRSFTQLAPLANVVSAHAVERPFSPTAADGAACESPLTAAVNHLRVVNPSPQTYLATNCAVSGRTIEQLLPYGDVPHFDNVTLSLRSAQSIAEQHNTSLSMPAFFFFQGEYNYDATKPGATAGSLCTTDKEEYKSLMTSLKERIQTEVMTTYTDQSQPPIMLNYQPAPAYVKRADLSISMAHLEASNQQDDVVNIGPLYQYSTRGGHHDANGYRWMGEMMAKVLNHTFTHEQKFAPLQPLAIRRTNTNELTIDYHVPVKPLVFDTHTVAAIPMFGFEVRCNGVAAPLVQVKVSDDGASVILTLDDDLVGDVEVMYASQGVGGRGNLRDSDPYKSHYSYEDLDNYGNSLRPAFEPKDSEGAVLYGKKYPLHNFSVGYYHHIGSSDTYIVPYTEWLTTPTATQPSVADNLFFTADAHSMHLRSTANAPLNVNLYSGTGLLLMEQTVVHELTYPISSLPRGLYLLHVETSYQRRTYKFIR